MTLKFQWVYAFTLHAGIGDHTLDDLLEAEAKYAEIEKVFARRFGRDHPESVALRGEFDDLKEKLAARRLRAQLASTQQCDDRSLSEPSARLGVRLDQS